MEAVWITEWRDILDSFRSVFSHTSTFPWEENQTMAVVISKVAQELTQGLLDSYYVNTVTAQCWEHSPATNVARIWFTDLASHVSYFDGSLICSGGGWGGGGGGVLPFNPVHKN